MNEEKKYVVGFCFDPAGERVVLIHKERPDWQAKKWNGVGGKVEAGEAPNLAMEREFKEETGLALSGWRLFCVIRGIGDKVVGLEGTPYSIYFYLRFSQYLDQVKTTTDEMVHIVPVKSMPDFACLPNLYWLIPMALKLANTVQYYEINSLEIKI